MFATPAGRSASAAAELTAVLRRGALGAPILALLLAACEAGSPRLEARHAALRAERDALREYLAAARLAGAPGASGGLPGAASTSVVPFADVLLLIRPGLITDLVDAALPIERTLGERYRVRADSARVTLRPGLALVELAGRASLVTDPGVFAEITLIGAFEVGAAPEGGADLGARVRLLGVETRDVRLGALSPPAERLVDGLARVRLAELNDLLGEIEIPVRLEETVGLPRVEVDEVTIPPATLSLGVSLDAVRVLEEGVFVSLAVDRAGGAGR